MMKTCTKGKIDRERENNKTSFHFNLNRQKIQNKNFKEDLAKWKM